MLVLLFLALTACSGGQSGNAQAPQDLETAAIERGLVRNPDDSDLTGLYARDTDRICVVRTRARPTGSAPMSTMAIASPAAAPAGQAG
jgi:hypothetical protein